MVARVGARQGFVYLDPDFQPCSDAFYPYSYTPLGGVGRVGVSMNVHCLGPFTIGDVVVDADVRLDYGEIVGAYHVNVAVAGFVESRHRGVDVRSTAEVAAVYRPEGSTVVTRWPAGSRVLALKIDRVVVWESLERLLGRSVSSRVDVEASMDTGSGPGREWAESMMRLRCRLDDVDSVLRNPLVANPLQELLVNGFLLAAGHSYREEMSTLSRPARPAAVRSAIDAMEGAPQLPWTVGELAARGHVGVRTLQVGFQRHVGMSPMGYLRRVRVRRAHADLVVADPSRVTVSSVAHRWGFVNLGRFAVLHQAVYGELPIQALRTTR
jgi:AraC-like DNA-binding protein